MKNVQAKFLSFQIDIGNPRIFSKKWLKKGKALLD
jgi:hypothetical protein